MDFVNLSLGTPNPDHRDALLEVTGAGMTVVSAGHMLPGRLDGVVGVLSDESCRRHAYYYRGGVFYASPFPRPIPGVPPSENLEAGDSRARNVVGFDPRGVFDSSWIWIG